MEIGDRVAIEEEKTTSCYCSCVTPISPFVATDAASLVDIAICYCCGSIVILLLTTVVVVCPLNPVVEGGELIVVQEKIVIAV